PGPHPAIHNPFENAVAMVFRYKGEPVLLSEFGNISYFKKMLGGGGTNVDQVKVGGAYGLWIHGLPHDVFFPGASPRLAGTTLLWTVNGATYRLEGKGLTREGAIALAESLNTP